MVSYLLRRNWTGYDSCRFIAEESGRLDVINKDKEAPPSDAEYVFRWGTTSTIPSGKVVNSAEAIHKVFNKGDFRKILYENDLAPKTWTNFGEFLDDYAETMHGANHVIVRPKQHARSEDMVVCNSVGDAYRAIQQFGSWYISEYIKKDAEYRVFVVSGRIVAIIKKIPVDESAVSWGCVDEGQFKYIAWSEWPMHIAKNAIDSFKVSNLDFGAIDIIEKNGVAYCLEINTAPQLTLYYGKCFAKAFNYILDNGRDHLPITGTSWRDYIHPAIGG